MKQRVITAVVLLALLAVVVWQINTPVLVLDVNDNNTLSVMRA